MTKPLILTLLIAVAALAETSNAATLRGVIQTNHILRDFSLVGPDSKVIAYPLNDTSVPSYEARVKRDGSWMLELPDPAPYVEPVVDEPAQDPSSTNDQPAVRAAPPSDVYLLKYKVRGLRMEQYRIDVRPSKKPGQPPLVLARKHNSLYPIASALYLSDVAQLPLMDYPQGTYSYFQSVQDFNALNYLFMTLKSPMILLALGAWAMVSLLPKIMSTLDPDEITQVQDTQASMMGRMTALQSGDWTGAMNDGSAPVAGGTAGKKGGAGASGAQAGSGSKGRKRN